ncbi:caspase family protein [Streptomyces krungchingensis]
MVHAPDGPQDGEGPRRYLIATAVSRYPKCAQWDRPGLVQAREQVIELFTGKLGYRHVTALGLDPSRVQLTDQLRAFCTSPERREDDLVVVYLSGHGEVLEDGGEHVLLMADADPADVSYTSLPTADLVRVLRGTRVRRLLLILDTCYSGQGGNELAAAALEALGAQWGQGKSSSGLVVVSSAQPHQQAKAGLFPHLLAQAVNSQATAGHSPAHLSVSAVVQQMNDHEDRPGYQRISLSLIGLSGEPPDFLSNPRHDVRLTDVDLALQDAAEFDAYALRRETEFTTRLLVRAMGYHGDTAQGWWFCGRHQALADLAGWLNHTGTASADQRDGPGVETSQAVRVVTAGPGSGKTAVLGLISALALPERRRTVPVDHLGLAPDWIPAQGSIDVIMYAQNLTNTEVLGGLAAAAGILKTATVGEFLEALEQRNRARQKPFTVLIDALDEAATPDTLCSQIIRPLIEHAQSRIRLLLGTRPYLLDRLGIDTSIPNYQGQVIDLDSSAYADQEALLAYTMRNLIQSRRTSPYRTWQGRDRLRAVADAVAHAAGTSFLVARFAAYTLASADTVVTDPYDPAWRASLPRHAGQAMRDDLTSRLGSDARRAADLLRPLAYAEGQGLPWEDIWAPLASAISGHAYTDADLLWLRHNAGSYVVEATENGRSAYRLYHQALTEHLRESTDAATVHAAFVDTLTNCVPYRGDATRDWSRAHPYTLNHLATHAAQAGHIDDILADTEYLVHAIPRSLTPHLHRATSRKARLTAAVYRTAFDLHATAAPPVRRNALALNAARANAKQLVAQFNQRARPGTWIPAWATSNDFTPALRDTITGHEDSVGAVACTVLDGKPVAVTCGSDHTVRVWDLATGQQIGDLTGHESWVNAVACTVLDGKPVAVTGGIEGTVRVWDLATGQQTANLTGHEIWVYAVACTVLDSKPVAVTCGYDDVRVWDLGTGEQIGNPLTGHEGTAHGVACTVLDDRPVAVTIGDGDVRVWDLATGQQTADLTGPLDLVRSVACTVLNGRPVAVTGCIDSTVRVWDLATGQQTANLTGPLDLVRSVACTVLNGRPVAVTGGDGDVRVWDLATGEQIGNPLTGHKGGVNAVACTVLNGEPVAVTCADDHTVRVWNLSVDGLMRSAGSPLTSGTRLACTDFDGRPIAVSCDRDPRLRVWDLTTRQWTSIRTGHEVGVNDLACTILDGRPVAVTGGIEGTVRVWDLGTGQQIGNPLTGPLLVNAVACTVVHGRPIAVTSASEGTVRVWDLADGQQIGNLSGREGRVNAVACAVLDGKPFAVTGGDGDVRVWDLATGQQIGNPLTGHKGGVNAVACTVLDGRPVAVTCGVDNTVRVWDLATGQQIGDLADHEGLVNAVACTVLDGRPVAVTGGAANLVQVWDLRLGKCLQDIVAPTFQDLAVTPDCRIVMVLGGDIAVLERAQRQGLKH